MDRDWLARADESERWDMRSDESSWSINTGSSISSAENVICPFCSCLRERFVPRAIGCVTELLLCDAADVVSLWVDNDDDDKEDEDDSDEDRDDDLCVESSDEL